MLAPRLYREYRIKTYLNMNHYIVIDGKNGEVHPHTWEFVSAIITKNNEFIQFSRFEKTIEDFMNKYQDKVLNEVYPFDAINPTIENVAEYFAGEIRELIRAGGGELAFFEGSETPTRTYIISFENDDDYMDRFREITDERISDIVDMVVDNIARKNNA